jgi:hypothetical protein
VASGIKARVVILGMGCSRFGERWDADAEDLIELYTEALADAGIVCLEPRINPRDDALRPRPAATPGRPRQSLQAAGRSGRGTEVLPRSRNWMRLNA